MLSDDKKRQVYEATGDADAAQGNEQGFDPRQAEEIFSQFFGKRGPFGFGGQRGGNPFQQGGRGNGGFQFDEDHDDAEEEHGEERVEKRKGFNSHKPLEITFKEACFGTKKDISVYVSDKCKTCSGSGTGSVKKCPTCNGNGVTQHQIGGGFARIQKKCAACGGSGKSAEKCSSCSGQGYTSSYKVFETVIPPGTLDGNTLRMKGLGQPGTGGGAPGDLILDIKVHSDPVFTPIKEEKLNVKSSFEISLSTAVLGGKVHVRNPDESATTVTIAPGTQNGDFHVIPQQGMGHTGDHKVYFNVKIPKNLNNSQMELFKQFCRAIGEDIKN